MLWPALCIHSGSCNSQWDSVYKQVLKGGHRQGSLAEQDWVQQGSQGLLYFVPATEAAYHNTYAFCGSLYLPSSKKEPCPAHLSQPAAEDPSNTQALRERDRQTEPAITA